MGLFDRLRGRRAPESAPAPEPATAPPGPEVQRLERYLREQTAIAISTSYGRLEQHDELATNAGAEGLDLERARAVMREEWVRREELAREHAADDQSSAVRRAFLDLHEQEGIAGYEALGFDNSEGHDLAAESARYDGADGYVFFHHQDVERIIDGPGTLHLRFGPTTYTSPTAAGKYAEDEAIGRRVVDALRSHGLEPAWDGTGASTITLEGLRWYPAPGTG